MAGCAQEAGYGKHRVVTLCAVSNTDPTECFARTGWPSRQAEQLYIAPRDVQMQQVNFFIEKRPGRVKRRNKRFIFPNFPQRKWYFTIGVNITSTPIC
jgi:hypothetical protein